MGVGDDKWVSVNENLPNDETPVLIRFIDGSVRIGEVRWEIPTFEETFKAFRYWDDPYNDGMNWEWYDIISWRNIPKDKEGVMNTNKFDIEKIFREVIMGENPDTGFPFVGKITFSPKTCDYELSKQLDDAKDLLQHIRNNWDKEDFDGEEMDKKIDELLGKIR